MRQVNCRSGAELPHVEAYHAIALLRTNAPFYQEIEGLKEVLSVDCELSTGRSLSSGRPGAGPVGPTHSDETGEGRLS